MVDYDDGIQIGGRITNLRNTDDVVLLNLFGNAEANLQGIVNRF